MTLISKFRTFFYSNTSFSLTIKENVIKPTCRRSFTILGNVYVSFKYEQLNPYSTGTTTLSLKNNTLGKRCKIFVCVVTTVSTR